MAGTSCQDLLSLEKFPNELLHCISNYLNGDENRISLMLAGSWEDFTSFYVQEIKGKHSLTVSNKCFYLTPHSWATFFTNYIEPGCMFQFNCNNCYWLPGDQLFDNIVKMTNLTELSIKGTNISLSQLARVFESCQKVTELDFSYQHQPAIIEPSSETQISTSTATEAFKKLTKLTIFTSVHDPTNYDNDPWVFIIKMLSWCRDCVELKIEMNCSGRIYEGATVNRLDAEIQQRWLHKDKTNWMKTLQSLVIINNGPVSVRSHVLDMLLRQIFNVGKFPSSLVRLWVHQFYFPPEPGRILQRIGPSLKAFRFPTTPTSIRNYEHISDLIEHLGGIDFTLPLERLPNLKTASGSWVPAANSLPAASNAILNFFRTHPNLEYLSIGFHGKGQLPSYVSNAVVQLLKLKILQFGIRDITREMVDEWVLVYPNIESLFLDNTGKNDNDEEKLEEKALQDTDLLSAIHFQRLTSVYLQGFHLHDGVFLLRMIEQCPKLEIVHLDGKVSGSMFSAFGSNLKLFFQRARKMKDFRLHFKDVPSQVHPTVADALLTVLDALSHANPDLERVCLNLSMCQPSPTLLSGSLAQDLFEFVSKMGHLTALYLAFNHSNLHPVINQVKQRIKQEIIPHRPALRIHFDAKLPNVMDLCTPSIHYKQIILPKQRHEPPHF